MGATWISWRTTTTVFITLLQIKALISVQTTVTGVEGQTVEFKCEYEDGHKSKVKYFRNDKNMILIQTEKDVQSVINGRFSLFDNTTGSFFIVRLDKLTSRDSGTYRCGVDSQLVIELKVSQANFLTQHKFHLPLFVTAAMCMAALLFVCLFTLCLRLAVKHQRSSPRQKREESSDYETMTPGVRTDSDARCSFSTPGLDDLSALPPPSPDLCSHFTSRNRESTVTLGLCDYVDVDVPKPICQYQDLDLSRLEDHVYHSLHGNSHPKDGPVINS
ncbi:uncharacterized protein LOC117561749 isoform X2 [Gymnodraco acuticeps]|uniref:Uncharacterized protein LOC117561749 isoform X2 n=1 Tax=Gymnodraco acuticeps TaxID=8218 RepID=A0A6P8VVV2_GYMAC|nr:uncharacterized protein LOC117561749 isoform X2 [Gymnodraco acuticeps]